VDAHARLAERVDQDTDDVLCTVQLVRANAELTDRLFDQLVDLLVERVFLGLRSELAAGEITRQAYAAEVAELAASCRQAGLLPLPSVRR
jgi:hypothetical protein